MLNNIPHTYQGKRLIYSWIYRAKDGTPLGVVGRYEDTNGKKDVIPFFKQKGEHWTAGIDLSPRPLFGLEKLALHPKDKAVFIVEGEKCAAAQQSIGCCAVTSSGGSQAANKSNWSSLNGFERVIILPDNDEQGLKYAQEVAALLSILEHPPTVEIKLLEGLSVKGDIVDWLKQHVPEWDEYQPIDASKAEGLKQKLSEALKQAKVAEIAKVAAPVLDECEPEPLRATLPPAEDYPVNELGFLLSRATIALHEDIKAPLAMCAQSVLAVASYAVQAHFDIHLPWGEQKPCTLFFLTVGESGSRKSSVDNAVLSGIKAKQKADQKQYMEDLEAYKAQDAAWQKAVEQSRKQVTGSKNFVSPESILEAERLCGEKPKPPIIPIRLISDPTIEGLYKLLEKNQPNIALFSDEGGLLIGGHALNSDNALKTMTRWSKMWDGSPFDRVRSTDGSGVLYGRRMAMHQLAQPEVMTMLLSNHMANEQGLLARCLVAWPDSLIGSRIDDEYRIVT
ncbi:MAG: DUF3987 domain-containing protein, partial [Gammaproteobacteria bacterium]|nr:DUF3987 domain-containing protein [Gammaproteobacteria bacterium]